MTGTETALIVFGGLILSMVFGQPKEKPTKNRKQRQNIKPVLQQPKIVTPLKISSVKIDAISGLRSLGYDKETATMRINNLPDTMSLEEMIKRGLST